MNTKFLVGYPDIQFKAYQITFSTATLLHHTQPPPFTAICDSAVRPQRKRYWGSGQKGEGARANPTGGLAKIIWGSALFLLGVCCFFLGGLVGASKLAIFGSSLDPQW